MFKVKNAKTINNLTKKSFNSSKLRNCFAIIAVILTTILFTSLFTIGSSLMSSLQASTMRQVGSSAHGTFKNLEQDEYQAIIKNKSLVDYGYSVVLSSPENRELIKRPTEIRYTSGEWQAKSMFALPTTGKLPAAKNEIATDTIVLNRLGVPCRLGESITLEYKIEDKIVVDTFKLVGFWQGDNAIPSSEIWLSPSYVKEKLVGFSGDSNYGKINVDVMFENSIFIENKMKKVVDESGLDDEKIQYGINWAYAGNNSSLDITTVIGIMGTIFFIGFSGYLIISNIFYISIVKDIQFFGLLKAVGITSKQIKRIIRRQAAILCSIGIPIGLMAGYIVGRVLTPMALSSLNLIDLVIPLNPFIFIGAAVFSIITVFISIKRPSKVASKVSAIEAIRNIDKSRDIQKKEKRTKKVTPFRMAKENIFRNKKKMLMVTASLSLGLIILNCAYSIVNGFDMDKYLSNSIVKDFTIADAAYFNVYKCYRGEQTLNKEFLSELYAKEGIESKGNIYLSENQYTVDENIRNTVKKAISEMKMTDTEASIFNEEISTTSIDLQLYGLDDSILEELNFYKGKMDLGKFQTGKYIIVSTFDGKGEMPYYKIGDTVTIDYPNGKSNKYEVMALADIPYPISTRYSNIVDLKFFIPSKEFCSNMGDIAPMLTTLDVEKNQQEEMEMYLENYCNNVNKDLQYNSKAIFEKEFNSLKTTYLAVGVVVSSILAFIGIANFVNTTITSFIARKRELAMLQSIGMTNRQMEQMLIYEGLIYVCLTAFIVFIFGSPIGYLIIRATMCNNIAFSPMFTVIPSILCLPVFIVIVFIVALMAYKIINKKSIVERLREVE